MGRRSGPAFSIVLFAALLFSESCRAGFGSDRPLVRLEQGGGGLVVFLSKYELRENGVVELRRSPSGGGWDSGQRRHLQLPAESLQRYRRLLAEGGYFSTARDSPEMPESETVSRALHGWTDVPTWRLEVFRDGELVAAASIPPRISGRLQPELLEIPHLRVAWILIEEFEAQWDQAAEVRP